ncbi:hypothetical protein [uncultured Sneathiella sp.]|uniref:hypothetical protein n=1 Tax=uncultured Sneathiella sp. TaxID=879315 RepID=UPI0030EBFF4A|tara:strand:- start:4893 stop:5183 length:291 start_codon:yes stop_codon:yes gene_type:complete
MSAPLITAQIEWHGIAISISYRESRWKSDFDHIEVCVAGGEEIPITETGYRSHFLPHGIVDEFGGAESYVIAWLDHEAEKPEWKRRAEAARQYSLL